MTPNRPDRIESPADRESVWDYPTPPRVEPANRRIRVEFCGVAIADSVRALRVIETGHPPVYYVPPEDVLVEHLARIDLQTVCEHKGVAIHYAAIVGDRTAPVAAWCYPDPTPPFAAIARHLAFYPRPMDACWVDDERAAPQPGDFYGGWITGEISGPFKGDPTGNGR
jgi:uncharacterized protein (DUF427 family)